jgi:TolB-like protein
MESLTETNVRAHVERLCDTDAFRASPTLCRVLRFLVDKSFESDDAPVGQRLVVEQSLGHRGDTRTRSAVAARMQIGRLRKLLADHYDTAGRDEPIRLEIPKRNYRLRFRLREAAGRTTAPLAVSQAALAIVEFVPLGLDPALAWLPPALTRNLIVALDPFRSVAVAGPFPQETIAAAAAGTNGFVLVGDVRTDSAGVHVTLRLLEGWAGVLAWATDLSFQLSADGGLPAGGPLELARVADALADETGVTARSDPLPIVLRMALACRGGDIRFAHRLAAAAEDLLPDCRARCEGMLGRLLHDDHVDALADALAPLELGWFT